MTVSQNCSNFVTQSSFQPHSLKRNYTSNQRSRAVVPTTEIYNAVCEHLLELWSREPVEQIVELHNVGNNGTCNNIWLTMLLRNAPQNLYSKERMFCFSDYHRGRFNRHDCAFIAT